MLRTRLVTALVALPLLYLSIVHAHPSVFVGVVVGASAVAAYEFFQMALPHHAAQRFLSVVLAVAVAAGISVQAQELWGLGIALTVIGGLLFCVLEAEDIAASVTRAAYSLLGVVYAGFLLAHFVLLHRVPEGPWWVVFTVFVAMSSDSGGYFAGRYFGRRPLAEKLSPKKTVEGAIGSLTAAVVAASIGQAVLLPSSGFREALFLGVCISLLGQLGDLTESMFKRGFGSKDSGWIVPGHGGVLDRIDSLVFPGIFSYYYALLV